MLDHPEKTARLLAELKAAVPFKVALTPQLVAHLRAEHVVVHVFCLEGSGKLGKVSIIKANWYGKDDFLERYLKGRPNAVVLGFYRGTTTSVVFLAIKD